MGNKYIAHASIDENGKIAGGQAGDQTGKEVCIRTWYDKSWGYVLRIDNEALRIRFADNMIDAAKNDMIGYNQNTRNSLLTQAKLVDFDFSKISVACACDCSSLVTIALLGAIYTVFGKEAYETAYGVLVVDGNCATTSTLRNRMKKLTMASTTVYSSVSHTRKTSNAVYGDIYLKEGSHVAVYIADGNEQTASSSSISVLDWQNSAIADGFLFPKYGADGEWGDECESVAKKAIVKKQLIGYKYPNLTKLVQQVVGFTGDNVDGKCGKKTKEAIVEYQIKEKLYADGCVGINTWKKILGV